MPRNFKVHADPGQFSDWQKPTMRGYRMCCCACGLSHEMEFMAVKITKEHPGGILEFHALPADKYQVQFRAKIHRRATATAQRAMATKERCPACGSSDPDRVKMKGERGEFWQCWNKKCRCTWKAKTPKKTTLTPEQIRHGLVMLARTKEARARKS